MNAVTYSGKIVRVFFFNPESSWGAGVLRCDDGSDVKFAGEVITKLGLQVEITGEWVDSKFGRQVKVSSAKMEMDTSPDALAELLAKHKDFEGIGQARARKIVDAAMAIDKGDPIQAIVEHPEAVASSANLQPALVLRAAEVMNEQREFFDALAGLVDQGWTSAQATRIVKRFGVNAPTLVKDDPYMLIGKVARFGFRTVDAVALKNGTPKNDERRIAAGLGYCLDEIASDGNTWTTRDGLLDRAMKELQPDSMQGEDLVRSVLERCIKHGLVIRDTSPTGNEIVADARIARIEIEVFGKLLAGLRTTSPEFSIPSGEAAELFETLNAGQRSAVSGFWRHQYAVISGGAGVGKTYTMKAVGAIARALGLAVVQCAPTGKAARRLAESTNAPASTVHRALEAVPDESGEFRFTRDASNPIEADLVIVDEVSMVDVFLMRSLLSALRPGCRLLIVGDHNQIPSVGPGAVLRDLLGGQFGGACHVLTDVVRQAGQLAINTNAILQGTLINANEPMWSIRTTEEGAPELAAEHAAKLFEYAVTSPTVEDVFGAPFDPDWDVQVLSPMRKGELGTWALNARLQATRQRLLGLPEPEPTPEGKAPKPLVGDRVIWTKNDYTLDLFNGTQAIVTGFQKGGAMELFFEDGREVVIPPEKRNRVEVAWAMTIHKAQGSEWRYVIVVGSSSHWIMHDRNLLYTAAGRAAQAVTFLGDKRGLRRFAKEQKSERRSTFGSFLVHGWRPNENQAQDVGAASSSVGTGEPFDLSKL